MFIIDIHKIGVDCLLGVNSRHEFSRFFIVKVDLDNNITDFQISVEEFLHGVVSLTNELVSCVWFNQPAYQGRLSDSRIQ